MALKTGHVGTNHDRCYLLDRRSKAGVQDFKLSSLETLEAVPFLFIIEKKRILSDVWVILFYEN
ncbi:hypothetical protein FFZ99_02380 [Leptospira interrogans]|uniref:hypothetical protein n=1 Tax=Leptospira interrogans TaxID=173 RepID=UPI0002784562|nr:hypothetical protein [Leptospira interrogans]EJO76720.1 hypothetical protein LEP1GSC045_2726 [Leptospira interrogans serovar Pomona str. Kennewicki LC82-25]EKN96201.1 hypothetical protein LEP1GSC014_3226 [Leptospira interrogans serovar Pomona str. Pomona]EMF31836.1 hypothetical protein LEP1GSC201_0942 [Leptospira interrogans serovar Pomona str. Fox 32256]EMJ64355.1 hypothetical protein LEP1GSC197_2772 [Leptospira interrogans serovar Pomona str. CSL4002]EMN99482.1 hypothetical protein LEP1GS